MACTVPDFPTGWEAPPSNSVSFSVPDNWESGRIWGRRDCNFSITTGPTCLDGWCNGGLLCDPHTGTGVPPATVAEWTLQGDGDEDFYDVSLVDGYNLPMAITNSVNCPEASCPVDLGPICPAPLQGPFDSTGFPVGCKSACSANLDNDPTDSANCCSGSHSTAATCPSSGVAFYSFFKGNCPDAYAYAFDESSGTALWTCDSGLNADYTLTFCPPSNGSSTVTVSSSGNTTVPVSSSGTNVGPTSSSVSSTDSTSSPVSRTLSTSSITSAGATSLNASNSARPNNAYSLMSLARGRWISLAVACSLITPFIIMD
ncbi:Pathogenesis-related protein 5 [Grifola frondosa]|uniref:Pathogenesis-related protein 5 n=1 Tax=Grifola frondosa TaxID=5627 RepID=A0A1C7MIT6_GRIFR|nr:Pathogenesis-related protein 5 [Grifola frondosa]